LVQDILEEFVLIRNNKLAIGYESLKKILSGDENSKCSYGESSEEEKDKLILKIKSEK